MRRIASLAVLALGLGAHRIQAQDQPPVFRTVVDAVSVDVLVTRDSRPVGGLTADDFLLTDQGVEQRVRIVAVEDVPITLLLVLDTSASVVGPPVASLRSAAAAAAELLRPIDRVALLAFSHELRMLLPATETSRLTAALERLDPTGATALYDATFAALAWRETIPGRVLMLLFSDGLDTASWVDPADVLAAARRTDMFISAVTVEDPSPVAGVDDLRVLAAARRSFAAKPHLFGRQFVPLLVQATGGSVFVAKDLSKLREVFIRVVDDFRSRYVLTYVPEGVDPAGWHELEVRVRRRGVQVQSRRGYLR